MQGMRALSALGVSSLVGVLLAVASCVGDDPGAVQPPTTTPDSGAADGSSDPTGDAGTDSGNDSGTMCTAPLADCDGNGSCETSTATDANHCGACGHDCGGGSCVDGRCQPQVIAPNVDAPLSLAVNSSGVFWVRAETAEKCSKTGCVGAPTLLANSTLQADIGPRQIFVNETNAYWLGQTPAAGVDYYVHRCEVGGCGRSPSPIGDYTGTGQLVGNSKSLIWYDGTGALKGVRLPSGPIDDLSAMYRESSHRFAVDETWLVFSNTDFSANGAGGVWIGKIENKNPTKLMDKGGAVAIVGGTTVLASADINATQSTVISCPVTGCGGTGTPLFATPEGTILDLVADPNAVYWGVKASPGAADGKIRMCKLPGCPGGPVTVAEGQANPHALALDGEFAYWANKGTGATNTGSIVRVRR